MRIFLAGLFLLSLLTAAMPAHAEIVDRVVAIVNDEIITLKETEKYVPVEKAGEFASVNEYLRNMRLKEKIDILIDNLLVRQQARLLNITVTDKDADAVVESLKKQHLVTLDEMKAQLAKEHVSYKDFYEGLKSNLLRSRVLSRIITADVTVTENQLRDYYNTHQDDFKDAEFHLMHIFISAKRPDYKDRALTAYDFLRGGRPFETVAKEFSDDPSGAMGGDIGIIRKEDLIPEFKEVATQLKPGAYSQIMTSNYGLHILKLIDIKVGDTLSFEAVKTVIQQKIVREQSEKRYKDFIAKLRKASYIEVKI